MATSIDIPAVVRELLADLDKQTAEAEERLLALLGQKRGVELLYSKLLAEASPKQAAGLKDMSK